MFLNQICSFTGMIVRYSILEIFLTYSSGVIVKSSFPFCILIPISHTIIDEIVRPFLGNDLVCSKAAEDKNSGSTVHQSNAHVSRSII